MEQDKVFTQAKILSQTQISQGIFDLTLEAPQIAERAKSGQFVNVYLNDPSRLLPRPISICDFSPRSGTIRLVYRVTQRASGSGTQLLSSVPEGGRIDVLGPLGNGFTIPQDPGTVCLVGGGIGIPPMIGLGKRMARSGADVVYVLGYRTNDLFLAHEAAQTGALVISTDDGTAGVHGTVVDAIRFYGIRPDAYYACGPKMMLKGLLGLAAKQQVPAWLSLEERMACGIGACLGCVCQTKQIDGHSHVKNARVCTEGPVFAAEDVVL